MYSSAFSFDAGTLWRLQNEFTPRVHEDAIAHSQQHHSHTQGTNFAHSHVSAGLQTSSGHSSRLFRARNDHTAPIEPDLFAPPLSAYLTEECGPSSVHTEYNTAKQLARMSGTTDVPLLSPGLLKRLQALRKIRSTGYTTLSPIGVGKTMAQIDADAHIDEEDSHCVQENSVQGTTHAETLVVLNELVNISNVTAAANGATRAPFEGSSNATMDMARDLDAQVVDADNSDTFDDDLDDHVELLVHDGFMAEEVEYQNDHSLGGGSGSGSRVVLLTILRLALSGLTPVTTLTGAILACDDEDMDMAIEE